MKQILLVVTLFLFLPACSDGSGGNGGDGGERDDFPLTVFVERLEATGDLTAKAVIASGVIDQLSDDNFPLTLYLLNEANYFLGSDSAEGSSETTFERGDEPLRAYIAEQGLTEEEFLAHPRLRDFIESHLILAEVTLNNTNDGVTETYTSAAGNEIVLSTDYSRAEGVVFANGVATTDCFFSERAAGGPSVYGYLCFTEAPIIEGFDWSN